MPCQAVETPDDVFSKHRHIDIDPVPSRLHEQFSSLSRYNDDYADVRGQEMAKRALIIAAAGSHNLLMLGPPGSGRTVYIP